MALAVLAVCFTVALTLHDGVRRAYRAAETTAERQQSLRASFLRLRSELRLAGLNVDPDGDPARPDEAIEAAYDTAVVLRADLDRNDPRESREPERSLAGGAFDTVSTGNDEIVAYVLARADDGTGRRSSNRLEFFADVAGPQRDGSPERVRIPRVALTHDSPPYTLYRVTLHRDPRRAGRVVRTPLAGEIRSLTFRYFDRLGRPLAPFDPSRTDDDIGGSETLAARRRRAAIRRVEVRVEGWPSASGPGPAVAGSVALRNAGPGPGPGGPPP